MVRTGLRLAEQTHLLARELPSVVVSGGYHRFWLPMSIAKGGSARWIYVPASLVRELATYLSVDRADAVEIAQADGLYARMARPLIMEDHARPERIIDVARGVRTVTKLHRLTAEQRCRLLVVTEQGLEPALLWLNEYGLPMTKSGWKAMFAMANQRCRQLGVLVTAHAHLLRHTYAVVTLKQLQRGHIAARLTQPARRTSSGPRHKTSWPCAMRNSDEPTAN